MGGRNRKTLYAAAFIVLIMVGATGALLADKALAVRDALMGSSLVQSIDDAAERARITAILANRENIGLLLAYINCFAPAFENMELSPEWTLKEFSAIIEAADSAQITVNSFSYRPDGKMLSIRCHAGTEEGSADFIGRLQSSGCFFAVAIGNQNPKDRREFTTNCLFAQ